MAKQHKTMKHGWHIFWMATILVWHQSWGVQAEGESGTAMQAQPKRYGVAVNATSKTTLLVAAEGRVYVLIPGYRSPPGVDADGLRAADGTPIRGHAGWWKFPNGVTATVQDGEEGLIVEATIIWRVGEEEFGAKMIHVQEKWGIPLTGEELK